MSIRSARAFRLGVASCLFLLGALPQRRAAAQSLLTAAGKGSEVSLAAATNFLGVQGLAVDGQGNLYFSESSRIRRLSTSTGLVTTIAGRGLLFGYTGDGGQALTADLNTPQGLAVDPSGGLLIGDTFNAVRRIDLSTGVITSSVVACCESSGDGGPAAAARALQTTSVAVDGKGNVFFADVGGKRIRRIDASTTIVTTIAGNGKAGYSGDGGPATQASLAIGPEAPGLTVDVAGNVYIEDSNNQRIRKVDVVTGIITTVAGSGTAGFSGDGGPAVEAKLNLEGMANAIAVDAQGNLYISDVLNARVRKVSAGTGTITTIAGTATGGYDPGPGPAVSLSVAPTNLALDGKGGLYVGDVSGSPGIVIRRIALDTGIMTVVGGVAPLTSSSIGDGGSSTAATLVLPWGLALDRQGNLLVSDIRTNRLRSISPVTGVITTIAGYGGQTGTGPFPALDAAFCNPDGLAVDAADDVFIADSCASCVYKLNRASGTITVYAGTPATLGDSGDGGLATSAKLVAPQGLAIDRNGDLLICDAGTSRVRKVAAASGIITAFAGTGKGGPPGDGGPATAASLADPTGIVVDAAGTTFVAERNGSRVRAIAPDGTISTIAGTGSSGYSGDGGPAAKAQLSSPTYLALDPKGDLYISDTKNSRIRKVTLSSGTITTYTGNGLTDFASDGSPAASASLAIPLGLVFDSSGSLFVASASDARVRAVFACSSVDRPQLVSPSGGATTGFGTLDLTWAPSRGAFSFDVYLDTNPVPNHVLASNLTYTTPTPFWIAPGSTNSATVSNLLSSTAYSWRVLAKGDPNCAPVSTSSSPVGLFTTKRACVPPDPFTLVAPAKGSTVPGTSVTLSWSASAGARYYDVYLGPTSPPFLYQQSVAGTSLTVTGLQPSTTYSWFLIAYADCDPSKITGSIVSTFTTSGPCADVGPVALVSPADGATDQASAVTLAWSAAASAGSYDLYLGIGANPSLYQSGISGTSLTVPGLSKGATYSWKIIAQSGCDPAKSSSSPTYRFTVSGTCSTPAKPSFVFVPPGAVAQGETYVLAWADLSLDPGGVYVVDRSLDPSFSPVLDTQATTATAASFVGSQAVTYYHRVSAVPGCNPGSRGPYSVTVPVTVAAGLPNVVITKPPQAIVTGTGPSLDDALNAVDPDQKGRVFTIQNIGTTPVRAFVTLNVIPPSPNFFQIDDLGGQPAYLGINLAPGETRQYRVRFTGIPSDQPAAYQGLIYVSSAGQTIIPYAFVNLKVGGGQASAPEFRVTGTSVRTDTLVFPGWPSTVDDATRPPVTVDVHNPGSTPMDVGAEIAPEVWVEAEAGWNKDPIPPGATRTLTLHTERQRALAGSALPRYTYLTLRTKDGNTARLQVLDDDAATLTADPRSALDATIPSYVVPSVVNATSAATGNTFVSKLRLSNLGSDDLDAELIYTPTGKDGFDPSAVRKVKVRVPRHDVVALTDPLGQLYGLSPPAVGQLEVRAGSKTGLLSVTSSVDAPAPSGGTFGFQLPVVRRGEGAALGQPHVIAGLNVTPAYRSNLILAETTGRDAANGRATLYDKTGAKLGEVPFAVARYGHTQLSVSTLLGSATSVTGGRLEITVDSGSGSVAGVVTVVDNADDDASAYLSRPVDVPASAAGRATRRPSWSKRSAASAQRVLVPAVVNGFQTFPGTSLPWTFQSSMTFVSGTAAPATFDLTYEDLQSGQTLTRTVTVPPRSTVEYDNVLEQLFQMPKGQRSQGPVFIDATTNGVVQCRVYSVTDKGTLGDAFPVVRIPSEALTDAATARPLAVDGLEQSLDAARGTRTNLILNEVMGQPAAVTIRLYEAGNRSRPIAEQDFSLAPLQKLQLNNVFATMGLTTNLRSKERTNVLCVVQGKSGGGSVSVVATTIDNQTGDTRDSLLLPGGTTPSIGF